MSIKTALAHGQLVFASGARARVTLFELTDDVLIVRGRGLGGTTSQDLAHAEPFAVDGDGREYRWFHSVSGGGPVGEIVDWVFTRPGHDDPTVVTVFPSAEHRVDPSSSVTTVFSE